MEDEEKVSESDTETVQEETRTQEHCFHEFETVKNVRRCRKCRMELKNDMY